MTKTYTSFRQGFKSLCKGFGFGKKIHNQDLEHKCFKDYLSYKGFIGDLNIFDNKSTYSFALKLRPFAGIGTDDINALKKIVSYEIPSGAVVQVVNYASPCIESLVDKWHDAISDKSKDNIYETLSEKRKKFFLKGAKSDLWSKGSGLVLRNFEVYFCVSFAKEASLRANKILLDKIVSIRAKIKRAFQNIGCDPQHVTLELLNNHIHEILFPYGVAEMRPDLMQVPQVQMHENFAQTKQGKMSKRFLVFEVDQLPEDWENVWLY